MNYNEEANSLIFRRSSEVNQVYCTILGVPSYKYGIMGPKTILYYSNYQGSYVKKRGLTGLIRVPLCKGY